MAINKRLKGIADLLKPCKHLVDVGTDHAYLPIYCIENDICYHSTAIDNKIGPINQAKMNIISKGLQNRITVLQQDGLSEVPNKADAIVIAGLGADTILKILGQLKKPNNLNQIVIQSNNRLPFLRRELSNMEYKIIDEAIVEDQDILYVIMSITSGKDILSDEECEIGPILMKKKPPLLKKYLTQVSIHYETLLKYQKDVKNKYRIVKEFINEIK
jgi:tRNA (adenine22-N1)-methyltransferase